MPGLINTNQNLIPIRVDVSSNDEKQVRIIDTLLIDKTVLPLPVDPEQLDESLSANALHLAKSILADAEVVGMGRTVRHFTNRLDVWSWALVEQIQKCVLDQLRAAFEDDGPREPLTKKPRKAVDIVQSNAHVEASESNHHHHRSLQTIIPIKLRLSIDGTRIHDDFQWDPKLNDSVNPVIMAQTVGQDLNLPPEAVQGVAISIAEQIHGLEVPEEEGAPLDSPKGSNDQPLVHSNTTAAWTLEQRAHQSNMSHLVTTHTKR